MSLSSDLISKFVKVTNDTTDTKKESIVYGTAVEYSGKMYARLDGSDLLTPISSTADTKAGDRVTVMIKDHTATVTGNISSPSAGSQVVTQLESSVNEVNTLLANKIDVSQLEAQSARIDILVAENATVKDTLTATNANIILLQAENANITQKLTANEADIVKLESDIAKIGDLSVEELEAISADIHNLQATYATFTQTVTQKLEAVDGTITNLDSKYATIVNLEAAKGRIADLEATRLTASSGVITQLQSDIADIDTLIFGSASGNVIQTSFANAVIAQLGNAAIKSAMIESVAANKITSGDIITNNVRVLSEDGSLIISDETIQISDENRVRVQIGKDASNDYSINIWDADGNLMFSQGGITDKAIKTAIIRNDMVRDDANISAKKLDIGSLFTAMNEDGSHTLYSSKVLLDANNQTLNVAFQNMTTKVTTVESAANTAQTTANNANSVASNALSTANTANSKADANTTNLATVTQKVTTQGTDISVLQGKINSKIWQQDIESAILGVNIGSRNILKGTSVPITPDGTGGGNYAYGTYFLTVTLEKDQEYVVSGNVKVLAGTVTSITVLAIDSGTVTGCGSIAPTITNGRFEGILVPNTNYDKAVKVLFYAGMSGATSGKKVTFSNVKMEKGNKATDWTPAPEDLATSDDITSLTTKYSELDQTIDSLTSTVASHTTEIGKKADGTTVANVSDKVSKLEQNVESFKTTVSNTYSTKGDLSDAINGLEIGARNYIILSKLSSYTSYNTKPTVNSNNVISSTFVSTHTSSLFTLSVSGFTPENDIYTLSGYIKVNGSIPSSKYINGRASTYGSDETNTYDPTTGYFSITQKYPGNSGWILHANTSRVSGSTDIVTFEKLKFEKGNKATDWTPAPEDVDADISAIANRMTSAETSILQTSESITSLANRTTTVENKFGQYSTTAQMNTAISQQAGSITSTVAATYTTKNEFNNLQVGVTNYLLESRDGYILTGSDQPTVSSRDTTLPKFSTLTTGSGNAYVWIQDKFAIATVDIANSVGLEFAFSIDIKVTGSFTGAKVSIDIRNASHAKALAIDASIPNDIIKDTWIRVGGTGTTTNSGNDYTRALLCFTWNSSTVGSSIEYRNVQLEFGNKWSDWKQSTFESIQAVATAQATADGAAVAVTAAQTSIEQLVDQISMLVVDGDNGSMMTQTADGGWQFNMGTIYSTVDKLGDDFKTVKEQSDTTDINVSDLTSRVSGLETVTEYVNIGTYTKSDGTKVPSIDLGKKDSDFKLKITNEEIVFTDGSPEPPVHIDSVNQVLEIGQAEIRTDLRIGNIVFAKRSNGNVGIMWKEV